jgi:hypothetical protein
MTFVPLVVVVPLAGINDSPAGAVLTLVFPLVFVFVVLGIWWVALRRGPHGD